MGRQIKDALMPDAVNRTGNLLWAPPVKVGMPCRCSRNGFEVRGRIVEVRDSATGEVMVVADPDQEPTVTTMEDGEGLVVLNLFSPGEPFPVSWRAGLSWIQRIDGQWEKPVYEVIREKRKAVPGWHLSRAVRCDPAYRDRVTGGGVRSEGGRFAGRGEGGRSVERRRWTTTLRPDALDVLRELAERHGIDRNEVVERLLLSGGGDVDGLLD